MLGLLARHHALERRPAGAHDPEQVAAGAWLLGVPRKVSTRSMSADEVREFLKDPGPQLHGIHTRCRICHNAARIGTSGITYTLFPDVPLRASLVRASNARHGHAMAVTQDHGSWLGARDGVHKGMTVLPPVNGQRRVGKINTLPVPMTCPPTFGEAETLEEETERLPP